MSRSRVLFLIVVLWTVAPRAARATINLTLLDQPLRLDITEYFVASDNLDPGSGVAAQAYYYAFVSRLNVQASWNHLTLGIRLDQNAYAQTPKPGESLNGTDPECPANGSGPPSCTVTASDLVSPTGRYFQNNFYDPQKGLEKMFLNYSASWIDATAGDSYVSLGRGIVLALRKIDQLDLDTTLLGGKVMLRTGDFSETIVAGVTNVQNLNETTQLYTPDPFDFIAGGRLDYRILGKVSVGIEGAGGSQPAGAPGLPPDQHMRTGIVIDAPRPLPWLSLYAEYVRQTDTILKTPQDGQALYFSGTAIWGITSWTAELKYYQNLQPWFASNDPTGATVYMEPPTLERVQIQMITNTDITAGRLRGDIRVQPWLTLFFSPEFGESQPGNLQYDTLGDGYVGAEIRWDNGKSHAFPVLEYRKETSAQLVMPGNSQGLVDELTAIETDFAQALVYPWSLEMQELVWIRSRPSENNNSTAPWEEGNVYLGLKYSPYAEGLIGYEFTTQQPYLSQQHDFFNASIQWNITSQDSVNLFVGGQRPGLKCISGVCRVFPAFEGVRLTFTVRG